MDSLTFKGPTLVANTLCGQVKTGLVYETCVNQLDISLITTSQFDNSLVGAAIYYEGK
jgi:hypothetical protein